MRDTDLSFSSEEVELLLQITRDASLGADFHERMEAVTDALSSLLPNSSLSAIVVPRAVSGASPTQHFLRNVGERTALLYATEFMPSDPMVFEGLQNPGRPYALSDFVGPQDWGKDRVTADFFAKHDTRYCLGVIEPMPGEALLSLALHRDRGLGDFERREREALRLIGPEIARGAFGALLAEKLARMRRRGGGSDPASGAILLDDQGDVLFAEPGAIGLSQQLIERGAFPVDALVADARTLSDRRAPVGHSLERFLPAEAGGFLRLRTSVMSVSPERRLLAILERPTTTSYFEAVVERAELTPRERQIAQLACEGLGNRKIAFDLGISPATVNVHLGTVYRKTGAQNRTELTRLVLHGKIENGVK